MMPERMKFLDRFDSFYRVMVNNVKEDKVNERDFYLTIGAKVKSMNQERREKEESLDTFAQKKKKSLMLLI